MVEVKDEWRNQSSRNDPNRKAVGDLNLVLFEAAAENFQVVRQPQIIVLHVCNEFTLCLSERDISIRVAEMWRLGEIKPANPFVRKAGDNIGRLVGAAISYDQQFEVADCLTQNGPDGEEQDIRSVIRR